LRGDRDMFQHQVQLEKQLQDMREHGMYKAEEDAIIYQLAYLVSKAFADRAKLAKKSKFVEDGMHPFCEKVTSVFNGLIKGFYRCGGTQ